MLTHNSNSVGNPSELVGELALFALEWIGPVEVSYGINYDTREGAYLIKGRFYGNDVTIAIIDDGETTDVDDIKENLKTFVYSVILNQGEMDMTKPN